MFASNLCPTSIEATGDSALHAPGAAPAGLILFPSGLLLGALTAGQNRTAGFGLGLALVKVIAEAHTGTLHVRSTVGQGSAFELHLPAPADGADSRRLLPPSRALLRTRPPGR